MFQQSGVLTERTANDALSYCLANVCPETSPIGRTHRYQDVSGQDSPWFAVFQDDEECPDDEGAYALRNNGQVDLNVSSRMDIEYEDEHLFLNAQTRPPSSPSLSTARYTSFGSAATNLSDDNTTYASGSTDWHSQSHGVSASTVSTEPSLVFEVLLPEELDDSCPPSHIHSALDTAFPMDIDSDVRSHYTFSTVSTTSESRIISKLRALAQACNADAQCRLGVCYYHGDMVKVDHGEALLWFTRAAKQGLGDAQYNLGCMHYGNDDDEMDKKAVEWFRLAASQGHKEAQYFLGECYVAGRGAPQNYQQALHWYRLSARQGYMKAKHAIALIERNVYGSES